MGKHPNVSEGYLVHCKKKWVFCYTWTKWLRGLVVVSIDFNGENFFHFVLVLPFEGEEKVIITPKMALSQTYRLAIAAHRTLNLCYSISMHSRV